VYWTGISFSNPDEDSSIHPVAFLPTGRTRYGSIRGLPTQSQQLETHQEVHCVVPAGGLSRDHTYWVQHRCFLPREVCLANYYAGRFCLLYESELSLTFRNAPGAREAIGSG
jgi:hypothetical protein